MKIRIKGNSIRFRLTQSEVAQLCQQRKIHETTDLPSNTFTYGVEVIKGDSLSADVNDNNIILKVPASHIEGWEKNQKVGFYHTFYTSNGKAVDLMLEKDFTCLDERGEDESDNYPNPKADLASGNIF
ncbi:MAG: hypothetical protein R3213_08910 [Flavobacteriaceae bacterium]|nr:hypothetical protein [Flavobacteriaceae bacterium]